MIDLPRPAIARGRWRVPPPAESKAYMAYVRDPEGNKLCALKLSQARRWSGMIVNPAPVVA